MMPLRVERKQDKNTPFVSEIAKIPKVRGKRSPAFWEELYKDQPVEKMPWFTPGLDHDFARAVRGMRSSGVSVLDLGTGPGTQAIAMAKRGFQVTATDISASAVRKAKRRSLREGCLVTFRRDDILKSKLKCKFDLILDRGCFHTLVPKDRACYIRNVRGLLRKGGYLFLKCFSHKERFDRGPFRFKPKEIRKLFGKAFRVRGIRASCFKGVRYPHPLALFCRLQKNKDQVR